MVRVRCTCCLYFPGTWPPPSLRRLARGQPSRVSTSLPSKPTSPSRSYGRHATWPYPTCPRYSMRGWAGHACHYGDCLVAVVMLLLHGPTLMMVLRSEVHGTRCGTSATELSSTEAADTWTMAGTHMALLNISIFVLVYFYEQKKKIISSLYQRLWDAAE